MLAKEVTLLTGFLGTGKTTLLNALIQGNKDTRYAIIENEIGEESIDAEIIIKGDDDIVELNNGCLCCSLNNDMFDILNSLWEKKENWDELIIEATGIADPANIALPFLVDESVKKAFTLKRVICVVDAELVEDQLRNTEEAIKQIAFADIILINKTENIGKEYITELESILKEINPFAKSLVAFHDDFRIRELLQHERSIDFDSNPQTMLTPKGMLSLVPVTSSNRTETPLLGNSHKRHIHSDIETLMLRFSQSMDIEKLEHQMMVFLTFQSANVYRVKGVIYHEAYDHKIIFQTVGKGISISFGKKWIPGEQRETRIVFIGRKLKVHGFERMLHNCLNVSPCT